MRALLILCSLTLIACGGNSPPAASSANGSSQRASAAPGSSPGTSVSKSGGANPTAPAGSSAQAAACWPIRGGTAASVTMSGMTSEADNGYDRVVIMFNNAVPTYELQPNPTGLQFTSAGQSVSVAGSFGVLIDLSNVTVPAQLQQNGDLQLQSTTLQEVRLLGATSGTAALGAGLSKNACPKISTMSGPPRLVIDFPT
jgi:hypothetical protein